MDIKGTGWGRGKDIRGFGRGNMNEHQGQGMGTGGGHQGFGEENAETSETGEWDGPETSGVWQRKCEEVSGT